MDSECLSLKFKYFDKSVGLIDPSVRVILALFCKTSMGQCDNWRAGTKQMSATLARNYTVHPTEGSQPTLLS